ncbi:unnamed protein product, partial [marine sediment metagenome]
MVEHKEAPVPWTESQIRIGRNISDKKTMKILIFTYEIFPQPGGIQKYIHTLSKALGEIFSKE